MTKQKIMIVDNDKDFLGQLEELLGLSGYEMIAVDTSSAVVDLAVRTRPAVIILDVKMPGKTGFQVAEELRNVSEMRDVPIIVMTGFYSRDECHQVIEQYGINQCLIKPFQPLDVIDSIEKLLSGKNEDAGIKI